MPQYDTQPVMPVQSTVAIHDNSDAVVGACDVDKEGQPKATGIMAGADSVTQKAGVGKDSPSAPDYIRIEGAMGPSTYLINGLYKPTTEMSGGMPVYAKIGDRDGCCEYRSTVKRWQVKRMEHKGTDIGLAACVVPAKCFPRHCPVGVWQIVVVDKYLPLPAITVVLATEEETRLYRAEVERETTRVVKGSHNVRIAGVTGTKAASINGM